MRYCGVVAVDCTHLTVTSQTRTGNSYQLGQTLLLVSHADNNIHMDMDKDRVKVLIHEHQHSVAELGSLSSGAKMAMQIFVKRVFTIFTTNASVLRVIANLQI